MKKLTQIFDTRISRKNEYELKKKFKEVDSKKKRRDGQPSKKRCNCDRCQQGRKCKMERKTVDIEEHEKPKIK